jgi:nicotinamidase-related amidase
MLEAFMATALLLIDVQQSFTRRPYFRTDLTQRFLDHVNLLQEGCMTRGVPVVRILHADGPDREDNPFSLRSGLVRPLDGLTELIADAEFLKSRHSALVGTGLSMWLRERDIGRLIVSGIRTEQCCETTARHANDEGFEVDFVADATLTFDMTYLDGSLLPARDIVARTCAVLTERFARIASVDEALEHATR